MSAQRGSLTQVCINQDLLFQVVLLLCTVVYTIFSPAACFYNKKKIQKHPPQNISQQGYILVLEMTIGTSSFSDIIHIELSEASQGLSLHNYLKFRLCLI